MKYYTIFCILVLYLESSSGQIVREALVQLRKDQAECAKQTGTAKELIENARLNKSISDDGKFDKFALCMLQKFKIMNQDGTVNQKSHSYYLLSDSGYVYDEADKCKIHAGKDVFETARKIMKCFLKTDIIMIDPTPEGFKIKK